MMRHLIKVILLAPFVVLPLWLAAMAFDKLSQNEVSYRFIADALDPVIVTPKNVRWLPPDAPLDRVITPADADRVGLALTEAWQALSSAQSSSNADILKDRFTGIALDRAMTSVRDAKRSGGRFAVLSQSAKPLFFHKDGSLMQVEIQMLTARFVIGKDGLPFYQMTWDTSIATLKNLTSGWRIFSYERHKAAPAGQGSAKWQRTPIYGVNYYPIDSPWRSFWTKFDPDVLASDFDRIRNLGGNTIRIFLTYQEFASPKAAKINLPRLQSLLSLAEENGIKVIPTLFDLKPNYNPGGWAEDFIYLEHVVTVLKHSKAVAFVDLKNEADLDFTAHNEGEVRAWLRTMAGAVRELAPNLSLTVGWSSPKAAENLTDILDVVSYHEFGPTEGTAERLLATQHAAQGLPVVVTEIGASSYDAALGFPGSETAQADVLHTQLRALKTADGVLVWTLYDFPQVDSSVIGLSPWRQKLQSAFGLFRADSSEKPAARAVRQAFTSLEAKDLAAH